MLLEEVRVPVLDRGLLFGDGVYDVVRLYDGRPYLFDRHWRRLARSLDSARIGGVDLEALEKAAHALINEAGRPDGVLYVHVTRGAAAVRSHAFPAVADCPPSPLLYVAPVAGDLAEARRNGIEAAIQPDLRWKRCDIKSLNLLGNVFALQAAKEAGGREAILVGDDGLVTEGAHTNVFAVIAGKLRTMPVCPRILAGITRERVIELARAHDVPVIERAFRADALDEIEELFLTGTTSEILPVVRVDGFEVGNGRPGPVTRRLQDAFAATLP